MLTTDIEKAIHKNLPAEVGAMLQQQLAELERLRPLEKELAASVLKTKALQSEVYMHQTINTRETELKLLADKVTREQDKLAVTLAQSATKEAERRADAIMKLVETIFRSPVVATSVMGNMPVSTGSGAYPVSMPFNTTQTTSST